MGKHNDLDLLIAQVNPAELTRDEWVKIGMGLKCEGYEPEVWDEWSAKDSDRYKPGECSTLWNGFNGDGVTGGTVAMICKEHGATASPGKDDSRRALPSPSRKKAQTGNGGKDTEELKQVHRDLIKAANERLRDSQDARSLAQPYLEGHIGITVDEALGYGIGVIDDEVLEGFPKLRRQYGDRLTRLCLPSFGEMPYFHVDRDITNGWERRKYTPAAPKCRNPKHLEKPAILNPEALKSETVFVVEGIQDALAVIASGFTATPLVSTGHGPTLKALASSPKVERVIVLLDNDQEGIAAQRRLVDRVNDMGKPCLSFKWSEGAPKDAGEWRAQDPEGLASSLEDAVREAANLDGAPIKVEAEVIEWVDLSNTEAPLTINMLADWMRGEPMISNSILYNEMDGEVYKVAPLPWDKSEERRIWEDAWDGAELRALIEEESGRSPNRHSIKDAFGKLVNDKDHRFNPARSAVQALPKVEYSENGITITERGRAPEAVPRLIPEKLDSFGKYRGGGPTGWEVQFDEDDGWHPLFSVAGWTLARYLKADPTPISYYAEMLHLMGVVARGLYPGCTYQSCLVLYGGQGIGKDTWIKYTAITPDLFTPLSNELNAETISNTACGKLVCDLEELSSIRSASGIERVKTVVSSDKDRKKILYVGHRDIPRSFVIAGSTNDRDILNDKTGNRRFPIVECKASKFLSTEERKEMGRAVRAALAEVKAYHDHIGKDAFLNSLNITGTIYKMMRENESRFTVEDAWEVKISDWLQNNSQEEYVCIEMAATGAGLEYSQLKKADTSRISRILDNSPLLERQEKQIYFNLGGADKRSRRTAWRFRKEF